MTRPQKHHRDEAVILSFLSAWLCADPWQREVAIAQMTGLAEQEAAVQRDIALFCAPASAATAIRRSA